VVYSTDNGPHMNSWPDAGMTPFRGEKNSNWEGAYRVPAVVRWRNQSGPVVSCDVLGCVGACLSGLIMFCFGGGRVFAAVV
jgi:arylsulfatase A-like enzyme